MPIYRYQLLTVLEVDSRSTALTIDEGKMRADMRMYADVTVRVRFGVRLGCHVRILPIASYAGHNMLTESRLTEDDAKVFQSSHHVSFQVQNFRRRLFGVAVRPPAEHCRLHKKFYSMIVNKLQRREHRTRRHRTTIVNKHQQTWRTTTGVDFLNNQ